MPVADVRSKQDATGPNTDHSPLRLSWLQPAGLVGLSFVNFFLRFLTLGLYGFWGKTEVRKRLWSAVRLEGEPLNYSGTGRELFLGFLVIFGVVLMPMLLGWVGLYMWLGEHAANLFNTALYPVVFFLIGIGTYRAQRYRLTRTSWRGIRGALVGSDKTYAWTHVWTACLIPLTLGWIIPWRATRLQKLITEDTRFGDRPLTFTAQAGPLYKRFSVMWVVTVLSGLLVFALFGGTIFAELSSPGRLANPSPQDQYRLGLLIGKLYLALLAVYLIYYLLSAWYRAQATQHYAAHTHFEGATFSSTVTGAGFVRLACGNFLIGLLGVLIAIIPVLLIMGGVGFLADSATLGADAEKAGQAAGFIGAMALIASAGLLAPIVQARTWRYLIKNLKINGTVPLGQIAQAAEQKLSRGEGLAQAFDIDGF
jgi:uncharacterized membrane protein YjgN (DUF898 family)